MQRIVFYTRPACCLCDRAKRQFAAAFPHVTIEEVDVDSDRRLSERYGMHIPVAALDGRELFRGRFDLASCRAALTRTES